MHEFFLLLKMTHIGVILCGESITRIPDAQKRFPDPVSGTSVFFHAYSNDQNNLNMREKLPKSLKQGREAFSCVGNARNRFTAESFFPI
jgi:hypothetical protein